MHVANKVFVKTTYNDILGISIPELLMNIISCHVFVNNTNSTVVFSCGRKLVDYYLSEGFFILDNNSRNLCDVPIRVKQIIDAEYIHINYLVMACYRENPSA